MVDEVVRSRVQGGRRQHRRLLFRVVARTRVPVDGALPPALATAVDRVRWRLRYGGLLIHRLLHAVASTRLEEF